MYLYPLLFLSIEPQLNPALHLQKSYAQYIIVICSEKRIRRCIGKFLRIVRFL